MTRATISLTDIVVALALVALVLSILRR